MADTGRQVFVLAQRSQLDQHWQVDTGYDLCLGLLHDRDGEVRRRPAKHVGQQDDAVAGVVLEGRVQYILAALADIVLGTDADSGHLILRANHMFHRRYELVGEPAMSYQHQSDHKYIILDTIAPAAISRSGRDFDLSPDCFALQKKIFNRVSPGGYVVLWPQSALCLTTIVVRAKAL